MKNDVRRHMLGPMVAAFDAQIEAEDAGILFTHEQWAAARREGLGGLPVPRARGSVPPPLLAQEHATKKIAAEELENLVRRSRRNLAHTCPARRK